MNHPPTDPIRLLLEAAEKVRKGPWMPISDWQRYAVMQDNHPHERVVCTVNQSPVHMQGRKMDHLDYCGTDRETAEFICAARNCIPALTALVAEREQVRALVDDLRYDAEFLPFSVAHRVCQVADRLAAIVEGK